LNQRSDSLKAPVKAHCRLKSIRWKAIGGARWPHFRRLQAIQKATESEKGRRILSCAASAHAWILRSMALLLTSLQLIGVSAAEFESHALDWSVGNNSRTPATGHRWRGMVTKWGWSARTAENTGCADLSLKRAT